MRIALAILVSSVLVGLFSNSAFALTCKGEDLTFKISAGRFAEIETSRFQVKKDMLEANKAGLDEVAVAPKNDGFTKMYDGSFTSPSMLGVGSVRLLLNPATGLARLDWDDADGGGVSVDLICE